MTWAVLVVGTNATSPPDGPSFFFFPFLSFYCPITKAAANKKTVTVARQMKRESLVDRKAKWESWGIKRLPDEPGVSYISYGIRGALPRAAPPSLPPTFFGQW
jgi:hypothetical protein